jgi:adenosine deaminase
VQTLGNDVPAGPPLVELHLHLEGAFHPARALALAKQRLLGLPPAGGLDANGWCFADLSEFLRLFGWMTQLLDGPAVYAAILDDLLADLERDGVAYAEVFVAFGQMHRGGVRPAHVLPALAEQAAARARAGGPDVRFIADATRQLGVAAAAAVLDEAIELAADCRIVGFGIGGDEQALPAADFHAVYERCRGAGLGATIHAGEGTSAAAVRDAVTHLPVTRVGHGIAAVGDRGLVDELARRGIALEICPTSNLRTKAWDPDARAAAHPLLALARAGVPVLLGSDDPAFFQTSLAAERQVAARWGATPRELAEWNKTAAVVSFLPAAQRQRLLATIEPGDGP